MPCSCCVLGCRNRPRQRDGIHFYRFPADEEKRKKWIRAVTGTDWNPTEYNWRICSAHFISGERSDDPLSPDYIPQIFSFTSKQTLQKLKKQYDAFVCRKVEDQLERQQRANPTGAYIRQYVEGQAQKTPIHKMPLKFLCGSSEKHLDQNQTVINPAKSERVADHSGGKRSVCQPVSPNSLHQDVVEDNIRTQNARTNTHSGIFMHTDHTYARCHLSTETMQHNPAGPGQQETTNAKRSSLSGSEEIKTPDRYVVRARSLYGFSLVARKKKTFSSDNYRKSCPQMHSLLKEKRIRTGEKPLESELGKKLFHRYGHVARGHAAAVHSDKDQLRCKVCGVLLLTKYELEVHSRFHKGLNLYRCKVCEKLFRSSREFAIHNWAHSGEKPVECELCGKCFGGKVALAYHHREHIKPYQCGVCKKSFKSRYDLSTHNRTHTGEKPFQCEVCGKCLTSNQRLADHHRIHTGEKPYKCEVCEKSFRMKQSLKHHSRIHTGAKPYQCEVCGKTFGRIEHLRVHKRLHTGERPYQCIVCKKSFLTAGNMRVHSKVHARDDNVKSMTNECNGK